ncbi:invertase (plasmid) [Sphingobium cloacae]|uniref:Invertase n=1 Tax=Sphingobium cloacae TaxID=120107 RepID=A0A1E1F8U3_9SPHN|nr:invertase [Sphingobium cloacae]
MGGILGYARVSTGDQDVAGQTMRLEKAGAIKVFTDVMSGKSMERPGLADLIAYARKGDTLAVVRLDRLGRSLAELLATVETLRGQGIALLSLEENRHVFGRWRTHLPCVRGHRSFRKAAHIRANPRRHRCCPCQRQATWAQPLDMSKVNAAIKLVEAHISRRSSTSTRHRPIDHLS